MKRLFVLLAGVLTVVASVTVGAGQADAGPLQQLNTNGNTFGTFGDHSLCRGAITYRIDSVAKKRGLVKVTATSHGFLGEGAGWKKNPRCRVLFKTEIHSGRGLFLEKWTTGSFGPRAGEKKVWDVLTGSGPGYIGITTYAVNSPVRIPQSPAGPAFFMIVP